MLEPELGLLSVKFCIFPMFSGVFQPTRNMPVDGLPQGVNEYLDICIPGHIWDVFLPYII